VEVDRVPARRQAFQLQLQQDAMRGFGQRDHARVLAVAGLDHGGRGGLGQSGGGGDQAGQNDTGGDGEADHAFFPSNSSEQRERNGRKGGAFHIPMLTVSDCSVFDSDGEKSP
jgi:hypothetical protein